MNRPRYEDAIAWIAANDEDAQLDPAVVSESVTVLLSADLFGKDPHEVAEDIVALRLGDLGGRR